MGSMVKSSLLKMRYLASYGVSLAGHLYIQSVVWRSFMVFGSVYGHHDFRFVFIGLEVNKFEMSSFRWVVVHAGWLWVGLSLTGCVLAMWIFCLDEGASWYSVELMVPGSVLPFSKVTSSQVRDVADLCRFALDCSVFGVVFEKSGFVDSYSQGHAFENVDRPTH